MICITGVLTHCAPTSIVEKLNRGYTPDQLTDFLQMVKQRCRFDYWFLSIPTGTV